MPGPIVLRNLTPEVKKVVNPPAGHPVIATKAAFRDGTRVSGPDAPEFNLASTSTSITAVITDGKGATSYEIRVDGGTAFSGLTASALTPEQAYSVEVRGIDENGPSAWSAPVDYATTAVPVVPEGVIFQDNFDNQPDYTSAMYSVDREQFADTHTLPVGWDAIRQDPQWSPSEGYPSGHESLEILASNADKARGGVGKSFVGWRDYYDAGWDRYNSENFLVKYFPEGYDQLYCEFYIRFQPGWSWAGQSKIFRFSSWSGEGEMFGYGGGRENGPVVMWQYKASETHTNNFVSFRGGYHGNSYGMNDSSIDLPRNLVGSGDYPGNWTSNPPAMVPGVQIPDKLNGGFINQDIATSVTHPQIYGPDGTWTKMAFFVKMNTPGVKDGRYMQWLDDRLVMQADVQWIPSEATGVKWNIVGIGGNDYWRDENLTNEDQYQEWYAIDDLVIRADIPEDLT